MGGSNLPCRGQEAPQRALMTVLPYCCSLSTLLSMQQFSAEDVRAMLREDAVGFALGSALVVAGLLTIGAIAFVRRRTAAPWWLGIFALLYGARLLIRTDTLRAAVEVAPGLWDYAESAITYVVPLPLILFVRSVSSEWRRVSTWSAAGVAVFAAGAIASDLILQRPDAAKVPNNLIAVVFMIGLLVWVFRRGLPRTRELRTVRIGVAAFSLTALADNLRGVHAIDFPGPELEPFGVIVTVACLGTLVAWRVIGDARRLVVIDRELSIARDIQSSILPQAMPSLAGVTVAARYRPMTAVAGDFYDFVEMGDERLGVLVADVTGHGVPAALIASMVKVALASQHERADRPAEVLAGINRALCGRLGGQYVTAAYLFVDAAAGVIRYAAAGHPPMLHAAARLPGIQRIEQNGLLLGFVEGAAYEDVEMRLDGSDRFLLYTDGLIEAADRTDDLFGIERVERTLATASTLAPEAAADAVLAAMDAWSGMPPSDDLTIVLVERRAAAVATSPLP